MTVTPNRAGSLYLVTVAYVLAVGVGAAWLLWGPSTGRLWLDAFIADVIATLVVFIFSRAYRNSSFYDAYWSVIPPLLLDLLVGRRAGGPGFAALLAGHDRRHVLGGAADRQLGLQLPRPAPRGLALPDAARERRAGGSSSPTCSASI